MQESSSASSQDATFDVVLLGFDPTQGEPHAGLKRVFGIDDAAATKVVESVPVTVQRAVNRVRAEFFRRALEKIGASVEIRNQDGVVEPALAAAPAQVPTATPAAVADSTPLAAQAPIPLPQPQPSPVALPLSPAAGPANGWGALAVGASAAAGVATPASAAAIADCATATTERPVAPASAQPMVLPVFVPPPTTHGGGPQLMAAEPRAFEPAAQEARPVHATQLAGAAPASAPAAVAAPALAPAADVGIRGPAHPTLKESAPAAGAQAASAASSAAAAYENPATAQTQRAPLSAFIIGDTSGPWSPSNAGAVNLPRYAPQAALPTPPAAAPAAVAPAVAAAPTPAAAPQPMAIAQPLAAPLAAASSPAKTAYGGLGWGEIDRGRYNTQDALPAAAIPSGPQPAVLAAPALDLESQPAPAALAAAPNKGLLAALQLPPPPQAGTNPMPLPLPLPLPPAAAKPLGAALAAGVKPAVVARIGPAEPVRAPSAGAMAAAMRKQAVLEGDPTLGRDQPARAKLPANARPEDKPSTPAASAARAAPSARSGKAGASAEQASTPAPQRARDTRSLWETIPEALRFPLVGAGTGWLIAITAWSLVGGGICFAASEVSVLGPLICFAVQTSLLALCADYHGRCLRSVTEGAPSVGEPPSFAPAELLSKYFVSGLHVSGFALASQLLLVLWLSPQLAQDAPASPFELVLSPVFWLLALGPACYWPMAIITASMHDDFAGVWYVGLGLRAIVRAPAEYAAIVILGGVTFALSFLPFAIVGAASGLPGVFFAATMGLPMALSHGVMGALAGHLVRSRNDAFA